MFSILKQFSKYPRNWKFLSTNVRYFSRTITGDRLQPLNEDTLTGRFLLYLDNNKACKDVSNKDRATLIAKLKLQPAHIKTFDAGLVMSVLSCLTKRTIVSNKYDFNKLLRIIDLECCSRLDKLKTDDVISHLCCFMNVIPHQITQCQYFHMALDKLMDKQYELMKEQLIQLIFFIGFLKKTSKAQSMLKKCLKSFKNDLINSLTKEDLCIICNSTFKTSTKIRNHVLLDKIKLYINDNLLLLNDPAIFVTLIKTLRHNRYQDDDILNTITCTVFFNKTIQYYSFGALCHILALYADYLYYNEDILKSFTNKCLEILKNSTFTTKDAYLKEQPRTKDIKRLLWALSNLNYKLSKEDIEGIVMPEISIRIEAGEFKNDPGSMVQIIMYLWMMRYKAYDLIHQFLNKEVVSLIRAKNMPCQDSLNLLLTCIYYEDPELYQQINIQPENRRNYNSKIQLNKRPELTKILNKLKVISAGNDIDKFEIDCQVPYINIIGIIGFQKKIYKTVNIELLDQYTCLKNTENLPTGLMDLKLRILEKNSEGLVVIEEPDIADCSDTELHQVLEDEISLVC
ncbi:unnamed protein product [Ceutorhynchus assimilis]|uniref:Uncharacterized protein n=1 Tax=Ceutorhynchus assimilis TaxID=467358 RepID=A0A9N9QNB8_9CUCU|nr:unnamed protein product [Ceutorhynchus assimilis]